MAKLPRDEKPDLRRRRILVGSAASIVGGMAATYPAAVAIYFGVARTALVYGRVFTAWGVAGLVAPGIAGYLYDTTGGYTLALALAAGAALLSAIVAATLPPARS